MMNQQQSIPREAFATNDPESHLKTQIPALELELSSEFVLAQRQFDYNVGRHLAAYKVCAPKHLVESEYANKIIIIPIEKDAPHVQPNYRLVYRSDIVATWEVPNATA
jgi:hypothetical protein